MTTNRRLNPKLRKALVRYGRAYTATQPELEKAAAELRTVIREMLGTALDEGAGASPSLAQRYRQHQVARRNAIDHWLYESGDEK